MTQKMLVEGDAGNPGWDFRSADTQRGTHGIHTYLASMIPQVAERLIRENVPAGGNILDPFSGGGSVLVESLLSGFPSTGVDINPLAVLISKAKTKFLDLEELRKVNRKVMDDALNYRGKPEEFQDDDGIGYWFKPESIQPLTALMNSIRGIEDDDIRTLFQCVFSGTVRDVSLTYRNEQRLRRLEQADFDRFNPDVFKSFRKRADDAMIRVSRLPGTPTPKVVFGSVLNLPFADSEFTNIICSPPYGDERNGVPYGQFSRNMLLWLGYRKEELLDLKKLTLGGRRQSAMDFKSDYLRSELDFLTRKQAREEALGFYNDYFRALKEMLRVTSGRISIVIGNRTLQGRRLDNGRITIEFMENIGGRLLSQHSRKLPQKRLPKMGTNFGAEIDEERILTFSTR
jgi:hypothetical protein